MGNREKAQEALAELKETVLDFIAQHQGVRHADIVKALGLESDFEGSQKNYLSWSILGLLVNEKKIHYKLQGKSKLYFKVQ